MKRLIDFNEVSKGDTVVFDTRKNKPEQVIKVGDLFRIGPLVGNCTGIDSDSITMKVVSNSFKNYK